MSDAKGSPELKQIDTRNTKPPHVRHLATINKVRVPGYARRGEAGDILNGEVAATRCGKFVVHYFTAGDVSLRDTEGGIYSRECPRCFEPEEDRPSVLAELYYHRKNPEAVRLAAEGRLSELQTGELWIAGEESGFALAPVSHAGAAFATFFHVRKCYGFGRSKVLFCGRVEECANFVAAVIAEDGRFRSYRRAACRCQTGERLAPCEASGGTELHAWKEKREPDGRRLCRDCLIDAEECFQNG